MDRFGLAIPTGAIVGDLGVGHRQLVEIAKALSKNTRVLILDEPTAALTEQEVDVLLDILRDLKSRGIALIYISHKLDEVFAIADRITVLRDGQSITTLEAAATTKNEVIRHMVGRPIDDLFPAAPGAPDRRSWSWRNLAVEHAGEIADSKTCPSKSHAGEVLGIGGLMGAGRSELLMHIFGAYGRRAGGQVLLEGRPLGPAKLPPKASATAAWCW